MQWDKLQIFTNPRLNMAVEFVSVIINNLLGALDQPDR